MTTTGQGPGFSGAEADLRAVLADLGDLEYEQQREGLAKRFKMRVKLLDRFHAEEHAAKKKRDDVAALRAKIKAAQSAREAEEKLRADPALREQARAELASKAGSLLEADLLAELVTDAKSVGLVGEDTALKLLYLAIATRHFDPPHRPVSVIMKGTSSAGKSYCVKVLIRFVSPTAVIEMTGMSPKWMVYASLQDLDFRHKMLFVHEACGLDEEVEKMLRVLLSEGKIVWRTVIEQEPHTLVVEGPTGLIQTTTETMVHWENETRLLSIPMDESTEQTRRVLGQVAKGSNEVAFERWHALDEWVALGPRDAVIPFQPWIGKLAKPIAPRIRRDLTTMIELVRAHALIHETQRKRDPEGRIVATLDGDYGVVFQLTRTLFAAGVELVVHPTLRKVVHEVALIVAGKVSAETEMQTAWTTTSEISKRLSLDRRTVGRWVAAALEGEFLENVNPRQGQGIAARLQMGRRPLPAEDESVFPTPDAIRSALANGHDYLVTWSLGAENEPERARAPLGND